jgi:hypothetical protein
MTEAPSEAFDRREVVVLAGETVGHSEQRLLPNIRTDAGGFSGFGEFDGSKFDNFEGNACNLGTIAAGSRRFDRQQGNREQVYEDKNTQKEKRSTKRSQEG